jgi:hypothetical protein
MTKKIRATSKYKDITRIDQPSKLTHGWYVRVCFKGKTHSKLFSDKMNGGKDAALKMSIIWRDKTRAKIGKPLSDRHIVTVSNTPTGIVGVRLNEKLQRYEVSWVRPDGSQNKTSVSIKKHGKKTALKLAIQKREEEENKRLIAG